MDKGHLEGEPLISEEKSKQKKDMQSQKRLLTLNEAAEYLGISYWTMREYAVNRCVACVKLPCPSGNGKKFRRTLIDPKDLDAFIERNRIGDVERSIIIQQKEEGEDGCASRVIQTEI